MTSTPIKSNKENVHGSRGANGGEGVSGGAWSPSILLTSGGTRRQFLRETNDVREKIISITMHAILQNIRPTKIALSLRCAVNSQAVRDRCTPKNHLGVLIKIDMFPLLCRHPVAASPNFQ